MSSQGQKGYSAFNVGATAQVPQVKVKVELHGARERMTR